MSQTAANTNVCFKECPNCRFAWTSRDKFLADPTLALSGYQANLSSLDEGLFLFQHNTDGCGTCLAVETLRFKDLYEGPVFQKRLTGSEECPRFCFRTEALDPCPGKCECRFVRDVLQTIRRWPKTVEPAKVKL
jgi:hypothetical protein